MRSRNHRRYRNWGRPWRPASLELSAEGLRTLALNGLVAEDVAAKILASPLAAEIDERRRRFLEKRVNRAAPDVRTLNSWSDAFTHFGVTRKNGTRDVNDAMLIRTFIWQFVVRVLAGQERPVRGNLRSIWYRELRTILLRLQVMGANDEPAELTAGGLVKSVGTTRGNYLLDLMEDAFQEMFLAGFYRYSDLDVYDARENFWALGPRRAAVVFFTEKEGLYWLCRLLAEEHGVTVMASRGSPIWVTIDYLAATLYRRGVRHVVVVCLCDHDPWGYDMARQIREKFQDPVFGFTSVEAKILTELSLFTPERIEAAKRYLLGGQKPGSAIASLVEAWRIVTGGIYNEPYGIHVDHAEADRILAHFAEWLAGRRVLAEAKDLHDYLPKKPARKRP